MIKKTEEENHEQIERFTYGEERREEKKRERRKKQQSIKEIEKKKYMKRSRFLSTKKITGEDRRGKGGTKYNS